MALDSGFVRLQVESLEEKFMTEIPKRSTLQTRPVRAPMVLVDLDISFWRLVLFFVKASLAAIPAAIIVGLVLMLIGMLVRMLFGFGGWGFWGGWGRWGMHDI
jgi:hypothetical protein